MPHLDDDDQQPAVLNFKDDPVVARPDSVGLTAFEFFRVGAAGIFFERGQFAQLAVTDIGGQLVELFLRRSGQDNRVSYTPACFFRYSDRVLNSPLAISARILGRALR